MTDGDLTGVGAVGGVMERAEALASARVHSAVLSVPPQLNAIRYPSHLDSLPVQYRSQLGIAAGGFAALATINALAVVALLGDAALTGRESNAISVALLNATPLYRAIGQLCVSVACIAGGFLAARIAQQSPIVVGALSAWLCCGLALFAFLSGRAPESPMRIATYMVGFIALGALGGHFGGGRARRRLHVSEV